MSKYNLKIDDPEPSEEQIQSHKDFGRVLRQYKQQPPRRSLHDIMLRLNRFLPLIIMLILVLLLIGIYQKFKNPKKQDTPPKTEKSYFVSPKNIKNVTI